MQGSDLEQAKFLIKCFIRIRQWLMLSLLFLSFFISSVATAKVTNIPIKRSIATQPITALEVIAVVKSFFTGRILSINEKRTYESPDCHQVKLLEEKGEFQVIKVGFSKKNVKIKEQKKSTTEVSNKP